MHTLSLTAAPRTDMGKSAVKKLRKEKLVPCALYGDGQATHFSIPEADLNKAIYTPDTYLIELNLEGKQHTAVLRKADFHPIHDATLHAEFVVVKSEVPITVDLPVKLTGTSPGVLMGGKLVQKAKKFRVKGLYTNLPNSVEVSIDDLKLGRSLKVRDLQYDKFVITMAGDVPVCSCEITRQLRQEAVQAAKTGGKK